MDRGKGGKQPSRLFKVFILKFPEIYQDEC